MTRDLSTIAADLRAKLCYEPELEAVMTFFYDVVAEHPRVRDGSESSQSSALCTIVRAALAKVAGRAVADRAEVHLLRCTEIGLHHGVFRSGRWQGTVVALDGFPVGIVHATPGGRQQEYFRFRIEPVTVGSVGRPN